MTTDGQEQKTEASADSKSKSSTACPDCDLLRLQIDYAWKWFQYHADQRLKAFNFFILLLGALLVAYATAMKEHDAAVKGDSQTKERRESTENAAYSLTLSLTVKVPETPTNHATIGKTSSYSYFATWVAGCGVVMSIAFLCIEIRNVELIHCGRECLDELEKKELKLKLRRADRDRDCFVKSLPFWVPRFWPGVNESHKNWNFMFTHQVWIRVIYFFAAGGFFGAAYWSYIGFK